MWLHGSICWKCICNQTNQCTGLSDHGYRDKNTKKGYRPKSKMLLFLNAFPLSCSLKRRCATCCMQRPSKTSSQECTSKVRHVYRVQNYILLWFTILYISSSSRFTNNPSSLHGVCRRWTSGCKDEEAGGQIHSSPYGASDWASGNPAGG